MYNFKILNIDKIDWAMLDSFQDREIFQTSFWLNFINKTQKAEPVIISIEKGAQIIGYFTGLRTSRYRIQILGSPFRGWTTEYMGFNLIPGFERLEILPAFLDYCYQELMVHYVEIVDRNINYNENKLSTYKFEVAKNYEIDLSISEEEMFKKMTSACRRCIRKAIKNKLKIEIDNDSSFANDFYNQLVDVFAKQSLLPPYSVDHVTCLIEELIPSDNILLIRVLDQSEKCIATGIFPAYKNTMYLWGAASYREHQLLRPNELLIWEAMRYWKRRGISIFNMGGGGDYKAKYGGHLIQVPRLMLSKYPMLSTLRNMAFHTLKFTYKLRSYYKSSK